MHLKRHAYHNAWVYSTCTTHHTIVLLALYKLVYRATTRPLLFLLLST